jgi:hypothetical protein
MYLVCKYVIIIQWEGNVGTVCAEEMDLILVDWWQSNKLLNTLMWSVYKSAAHDVVSILTNMTRHQSIKYTKCHDMHINSWYGN